MVGFTVPTWTYIDTYIHIPAFILRNGAATFCRKPSRTTTSKRTNTHTCMCACMKVHTHTHKHSASQSPLEEGASPTSKPHLRLQYSIAMLASPARRGSKSWFTSAASCEEQVHEAMFTFQASTVPPFSIISVTHNHSTMLNRQTSFIQHSFTLSI